VEPTTSEIPPDNTEEFEIREEIMDEFTEQTSIQTSSNLQDQHHILSKTYTYHDIQTASIALTEFENLFSNCVFYLSREVPRYSLEFIIRTFGGQVGWDETCGIGSPFNEMDDRITHHVVDRPTLNHRFLSRVYIQPQWVYDCVNVRKLLKTELYQPGKTLPAHLSPFVEHKEGDYIPDIKSEFEGGMEEMEVEEMEVEEMKEDNSNEENDSDNKDDDDDDDDDDGDDDEQPDIRSSRKSISPPIKVNEVK
jgi:pescadillo